MGALPKRRISKARKGNRRAHQSINTRALSVCPQCKRTKLSHYRCSYCRYYGSEITNSSNKTDSTIEKKEN